MANVKLKKIVLDDNFLFDEMFDACIYFEIIFDKNKKPVDFKIIAVNKAFLRLAQFKSIVGKTIAEVYPQYLSDNLEMVINYVRIALSGKTEIFEICFKPLDIWFKTKVCSVSQGYVMVILEDITEFKKTKVRLELQKDELEIRNKALTLILEQVQFEKNKIKEDVVNNIGKVVLPLLDRIRVSNPKNKYVQMLEESLSGIANTFGSTLSRALSSVTSREGEIANMIKNNLTSKEIGMLLNISSTTVDKHRRNIRKKLEISKKKVNLVTYLKSM